MKDDIISQISQKIEKIELYLTRDCCEKVCGGLLALPPLLGWGEYNIMENGIRY